MVRFRLAVEGDRGDRRQNGPPRPAATQLTTTWRDRRPHWARLAWQYLRLPRFHPAAMISANKTVAGFNLVFLWDPPERLAAAWREVLELAARGAIRPRVDRLFPLAEAAQAQTYLQERRTRGKVLLRMQ